MEIDELVILLKQNGYKKRQIKKLIKKYVKDNLLYVKLNDSYWHIIAI